MLFPDAPMLAGLIDGRLRYGLKLKEDQQLMLGDGTNGNLEIIDSDAAMAGDPVYARAMGPMQFIPETWRLYGVDGNRDGEISPDNFDDAALAAAGYLCYRGKDMSTPRGWMKALRAYNNSDVYARAVRDWATAYAAGHPL
jgi:membrane-bound lytic murein transglycosylase B